MMTEFNKLYNLILESIIVEDKNTLVSMIKKYRDDLLDPELIINYLTDKYNNYKLNLLLTNCICNLTLGGIDSLEQRKKDIAKVVTILKKVPDINVYLYTDIDSLLSEYDYVLRKAEDKQKIFDPKFLDTIPVFSNKEEVGNGIVIYTVKDNEIGLKTIRKIIDLQLGEDANPWCLIARKSDTLDSAKNFWKQYNGCPKRVAFQNGKILAFQASSRGKRYWWDLQDVGTSALKDRDGNDVLVPSDLEANKEYKKNIILQLKNKLIYNLLTDRYDSDTQLEITNDMIVDGHLPFKIGVVRSRFICRCESLTTLEGGPTRVFFDYDISRSGVKNLIGMPKLIGDCVYLEYCHNLLSLEGAPSYVGNSFIARGTAITSLKGAPERVNNCFDVSLNPHLVSLLGCPKYIGNDFRCKKCGKQFTFKDVPTDVEIHGDEEY